MKDITPDETESTLDKVIDRVLVEIQRDIEMGDVTALDELLRFVPIKNLKAYLSEE